MKIYFKNPKYIIIGVSLAVLGIGISFLLFYMSKWFNWGTFPYYIPLIAFVFVYGLLAYVSGDIVYLVFKKGTGEFHPVVPKEVQEKMFRVRIPFIYGLILTLLVLAIFFIISLFMSGRWPLL